MRRWLAPLFAVAIGLGCGETTAPMQGPAQLCSRLHREILTWEGHPDACGPDVTLLSEITAIGNGLVLQRRRFAPGDELFQLTQDGLVAAAAQAQIMDERISALTLLPGPEPRVLVTQPKSSSWSLYSESATITTQMLVSPAGGDWPTDVPWKSARAQPWGHEFVGLEGGQVLDRDLGDGSTRVWLVDSPPGGTPTLALRTDLAGGARDAFVRGHRLVYLAPGRLLEWSAPPHDDGAPPADCPGAPFAIWSYSLDAALAPRDPFDAAPVSSGCWPDIGAGNDIVGDGDHLFVRVRATGELRSYAVDPTAADPLAAPPVDTRQSTSPEAELLKSVDWTPPTQSPAIKRLVLIIQDGRSFDSYYGRYCRGTPNPNGSPLACAEGPECCETLPDPIPGVADGCHPLDAAEDGHTPRSLPDDMRNKINAGAMDGFAGPPSGDPLDVACAAPDPDAGPVTLYRELLPRAALADRMFQTFAYLDGAPLPNFMPDAENLVYLGTTRYISDPLKLNGTPFLTTELGRLDVPWAFYAGGDNLRRILYAPVEQPDSFDPLWYPFRELELGELQRDLALGQLPSVSMVLPDGSKPEYGEGPGHSPADAIAFTRGIIDAIAASPYQKDTLVLLTYVTAGGFYDHVHPPRAPSQLVDATDEGLAAQVPYGPRVPLLALGRFARANGISHVQLELSSLAVFIEWNWLQGRALKTRAQTGDPRSYRDATANNIGSLLDPTKTGEPAVPAYHAD
jgi:hypothetical protein